MIHLHNVGSILVYGNAFEFSHKSTDTHIIQMFALRKKMKIGLDDDPRLLLMCYVYVYQGETLYNKKMYASWKNRYFLMPHVAKSCVNRGNFTPGILQNIFNCNILIFFYFCKLRNEEDSLMPITTIKKLQKF